MNQTALASRCGWSGYTRISNYEKDLRQPGMEEIEKMAEALRVTPSELAFGVSGDQVKQNVAQYTVGEQSRTVVIPPEIAPLIEDILNAWNTNTVTRRQLYALQQTIRANANMELLPSYQEPRGPGITKNISKHLPTDETSH